MRDRSLDRQELGVHGLRRAERHRHDVVVVPDRPVEALDHLATVDAAARGARADRVHAGVPHRDRGRRVDALAPRAVDGGADGGGDGRAVPLDVAVDARHVLPVRDHRRAGGASGDVGMRDVEPGVDDQDAALRRRRGRRQVDRREGVLRGAQRIGGARLAALVAVDGEEVAAGAQLRRESGTRAAGDAPDARVGHQRRRTGGAHGVCRRGAHGEQVAVGRPERHGQPCGRASGAIGERSATATRAGAGMRDRRESREQRHRDRDAREADSGGLHLLAV